MSLCHPAVDEQGAARAEACFVLAQYRDVPRELMRGWAWACGMLRDLGNTTYTATRLCVSALGDKRPPTLISKPIVGAWELFFNSYTSRHRPLMCIYVGEKGYVARFIRRKAMSLHLARTLE